MKSVLLEGVMISLRSLCSVVLCAVGLWLSGGVAHAVVCRPQAINLRNVTHEVGYVNGRLATTFKWYDSKCLPRTVSLLQQSPGASYNGGFAWQMTYQVKSGSGPAKTITVSAETNVAIDPDGDGGFGYFVSHERERCFVSVKADGSCNPTATIASEIYDTDDSPLGLDFPVTGKTIPLTSVGAAAQRFTTTYHHYGTTSPHTLDDNGNDSPPLSLTEGYADYPLPVTITWVFQHGFDYPRIDYKVSLASVPQANLVSFDMRGPYGVMVFDNGTDGDVTGVEMGDFYKLIIASPPTLSSSWTWNTANTGGRFNAMIAGSYEMGLFEPVAFASSSTADNYAPQRDYVSSAFATTGCPYGGSYLFPCIGTLPYQSVEDSLPALPNGDITTGGTPTNFKKMAWGTSSLYGMDYTTAYIDDNSDTEPLVGWPSSGVLGYSVCVVLGETVTGGLTATAAATPTANCATATTP